MIGSADTQAAPSGRARRFGRLPLYLQTALIGGAFALLVQASLPPTSYTQDLQVEYLTALALREGIDFFTPLTELSAKFFPQKTENFPHPNPHPPFLSLVFLPLTAVPFVFVVPLFLLTNLVVLYRLSRQAGLSPSGSLTIAAWPPVFCVLRLGQYEVLILALLVLGWRAAAEDRDWRAGILLGLAAAVKLYPTLFLIPFVVQRR
jgi:hypothetical protein